MKNAHLRFGHLSYTRIFKKSTTQFRVPLDRFIGERERGSQVKAHLISVIGGDTQIAALSAAVANCDWFQVEDAEGRSFRVSLGAKAECYRGSVPLREQKRALRHLVAVSEELAETAVGPAQERVILINDAPQFVWASVAHAHGIPGCEEWADWMLAELKRVKAVESILGIGCRPVLIKGSKRLFMNVLSRGVHEGKLHFPENNGPSAWNRFSLPQFLVPQPF